MSLPICLVFAFDVFFCLLFDSLFSEFCRVLSRLHVNQAFLNAFYLYLTMTKSFRSSERNGKGLERKRERGKEELDGG